MPLRPVRTLRGAVVASTALALALSVAGAAPAEPGPDDLTRSFDTTSPTGTIPDGQNCVNNSRVPGMARSLFVPVSGVSGRITDVQLSLGLTHTWSSDVTVTLTPPSGAFSVVVLGGHDVCEPLEDSDLGGTYVFADGGADFDTAATLPPTQIVPSGTYAASFRGNPITSLTTPFETTEPNGNWLITVTDSATFDTGSVTSASLTLTEDATAPSTTITAGPRDGIRLVTPGSYRFDSPDDDLDGFECQVDNRPYVACTSPYTVRGVQPGRHVVRVRAVDTSGNADRTPAQRAFVVRDVPCERATVKAAQAKKALKKAKRSGKPQRIKKARKAQQKAARARARAC